MKHKLLFALLILFAIGLKAQTNNKNLEPTADSVILLELRDAIARSGDLIDSLSPQKAHDLLEDQLQDKHDFLKAQDTLHSRLFLLMARAKINLGEYHKADSLVAQAIAKSNKVPREINHIYPTCLSHKAEIKYHTNDLDSSEYYYNKTIGFYRIVHGNLYSRIANTYSDICMVLLAKGRFESSLKYINKAISHYSINVAKEVDQTLSLFYRNKGTTFQYLNQIDSALYYHKESLDIHINLHGNSHFSVASAYNSLGSAYAQQGDVYKQLKCLEKAKIYYDSPKGQRDNGRYNFYGNIALAYKNIGNLNQSDLIYKANIADLLENEESREYRLSIEYHNYASLMIQMGQYHRAKMYLDSSFFFIPEELAGKFIQLPDYFNTYGMLLSNMGDQRSSLAYYEKSIRERIKLTGKDNSSLSTHYHNIAVAYSGSEEYEKSIEFSFKAIDNHLASFSELHLNMPFFYDNIGSCYVKLKEYDLAVEFFNKSRKVYEKLGIAGPSKNSGYWLNLARCEYEREDYVKALGYICTAIDGFDEESEQNNLALGNLYTWKGLILQKQKRYNEAEHYLLDALHLHGYDDNMDQSLLKSIAWVESDLQAIALNYHLLYLYSCAEEYRIKCSEAIDQAIEVTDYRKSFSRLGRSSRTKAEVRENYELRLKNLMPGSNMCDYESDQYLKIFETMELSKYQELSDIVNDNNALNYANFPDSLIEQEFAHRNIIYSLETQKQKIQDPVDSLFLDLSERLSVERIKYEQFKTDLEQISPEYYHLKYDKVDHKIETIQSQLQVSNQALIEYFVGDSSIYTFTILPDTFFVDYVKLDFPLNDWVEDMLHAMYDPNTVTLSNGAEASYHVVAFKIYKKVFANVDERLPENTDLIIVPDGILGYIPFDALLTNSNDQKSFLIKDHQISYAYSASLLLEMANRKHSRSRKNMVLAFAPSFDQLDTLETILFASRISEVSNSRNSLGPLIYNDDEVLAISKFANTDLFLDSLATKENFLQTAKDYSIIHLSTHGKANDNMGDYSYLAFYDKQDSVESRLYNRELYGLSLNADMVVLSACETGIGELQRGEGIISLARGFSYAGAKSIITTLWSVNDQSTQKIMELFYANLATGLRKDAALRKAKLDYIQDFPHLGNSPYFWAGIIPIGDMSPMELDPHWYDNGWVWLSMTGLFMAAFLGAWKKFDFFSKI